LAANVSFTNVMVVLAIAVVARLIATTIPKVSVPGIVTEFGLGVVVAHATRADHPPRIPVLSQRFGLETILGAFAAGSCWVILRRIQEFAQRTTPRSADSSRLERPPGRMRPV
jgi:Kef-type K+ transport system membrane component KefB